MTLRAYSATLALLATILIQDASAAPQGCSISSAMEEKRQEERDRRLRDIDTRFQVLQQANDLMRMCLDNFPSFPTQLPTTTVLQEAFKRVRQQACTGLMKKAQQNYDAAVQAAQNAAYDALRGASTSLPGGSSNLPVPQSSVPTSRETGGLVDSLRRFFQ